MDEGLSSSERDAGGVRATPTPIVNDTIAQMIVTTRTCRDESAFPDTCHAAPEASSMPRCLPISRRRAKTIPARSPQRKRLAPIPAVRSDCEGVISTLQMPVAAKMAKKWMAHQRAIRHATRAIGTAGLARVISERAMPPSRRGGDGGCHGEAGTRSDSFRGSCRPGVSSSAGGFGL